LNLSERSRPNIPQAVAKDRSAELIVKKFSKSSFTKFEIILIPMAVNNGKNIITKSKFSTN
jgi:hypothetical protein